MFLQQPFAHCYPALEFAYNALPEAKKRFVIS